MIKPWRNALGTKSGADFGTDRLKYFGYNITGRCNIAPAKYFNSTWWCRTQKPAV